MLPGRGARRAGLGHHPRFGATLATAALALSGAACVGVAVVRQQHPPTPPVSAPAPPGPSAREPSPAGVAPSPQPAAPPVVGPVLAASAPLHLAIPAIGVQSTLQELGQNADGSMEVPAPGPGYDQAGWYRHSPPPGSLGPAVIAGHVDSRAGPSVFFRLGSVRPNDTVLVTRVDGSVAVFAVDEVHRFPKIRFPTELVYGNTDHAALRLITCGGQMDRETGHHLDNIVVLASLVGTGAEASPAPHRPAEVRGV